MAETKPTKPMSVAEWVEHRLDPKDKQRRDTLVEIEAAEDAQALLRLFEAAGAEPDPRRRERMYLDLSAAMQRTKNEAGRGHAARIVIPAIRIELDRVASNADETPDRNLLRTCAAYAELEDIPRLRAMMDRPAQPEYFYWDYVFGSFLPPNPDRVAWDRAKAEVEGDKARLAVIKAMTKRQIDQKIPLMKALFQSLHETLPKGEAEIAAIGWGNTLCYTYDSPLHLYDSDHGVARLSAIVIDAAPASLNRTLRGMTALAFLEHARRDELLAAALKNPLDSVRIEAAWAAARVGKQQGREALLQYLKDPRFHYKASRFLNELEIEFDDPREAEDPLFEAQTELVRELSSPDGGHWRPPDEMRLVGRLRVTLPEQDAPLDVGVVRFRYQPGHYLDHEVHGAAIVAPGLHTSWFDRHELAKAFDEEAIDAAIGVRIVQETRPYRNWKEVAWEELCKLGRERRREH